MFIPKVFSLEQPWHNSDCMKDKGSLDSSALMSSPVVHAIVQARGEVALRTLFQFPGDISNSGVFSRRLAMLNSFCLLTSQHRFPVILSLSLRYLHAHISCFRSQPRARGKACLTSRKTLGLEICFPLPSRPDHLRSVEDC